VLRFFFIHLHANNRHLFPSSSFSAKPNLLSFSFVDLPTLDETIEDTIEIGAFAWVGDCIGFKALIRSKFKSISRCLPLTLLLSFHYFLCLFIARLKHTSSYPTIFVLRTSRSLLPALSPFSRPEVLFNSDSASFIHSFISSFVASCSFRRLVAFKCNFSSGLSKQLNLYFDLLYPCSRNISAQHFRQTSQESSTSFKRSISSRCLLSLAIKS
jgi:hypothetical protein